MSWENFYLICFLVGFLFSLFTFVLGSGRLHLPHGHGAPSGAGHGGHGGAKGAAGRGGAGAVLNPPTMAAFLAWFGGAGYLLTRFSSIWALAALGLAGAAGVAGGGVVFWFLARLAPEGEDGMDPADYEMTGVLGRVSSTVRRGGTGEMIYQRDGARRSAPIRSEDGEEIGRGVEVVVTRYERGVAYVRRWDELTS